MVQRAAYLYGSGGRTPRRTASRLGARGRGDGARWPIIAVCLLVGSALSTAWYSHLSTGDASPSAATGVEAVITLNPSVTFQTITGWEATAQVGQEDSAAFDNYKDALFDLLVDDLGINRVRLEIISGAENKEDFWQQFQDGLIAERDEIGSWRDVRSSTVNDNADPFDLNMNGFQFSQLDHTVDTVVLPLKQRVEANGETLFINLNYVGFTKSIGAAGTPGLVYVHDDPDEYAEFVLATHIHLRDKYGWIPDAWEVILEPDNTIASSTFRATWAATGAQGTLIGNCIVATAARLAANGFTQRFIAPSNTSMAAAITYFNQMAGVPGAMQHVDEFSYHRYDGVSDSNLSTIAALAANHGINTAMLEHIGSTHQDLHKDLKLGNNSAWQQFTLAWITSDGGSDNGGNLYLVDDETDPANPTISMGWRTGFLRLYYKFIRRGAVRMDASTSNAGYDPVAFTNVDGKVVTVVKTSIGGAVSIQGLQAGTYGIKYTTPAEDDVDRASQSIRDGEPIIASIPRNGVIVIYGMCPGCIGDVNSDGRVDGGDLSAIVACFTGGPNVPPTAGCVSNDLDRDNDVDLDDIALFQASYTGP